MHGALDSQSLGIFDRRFPEHVAEAPCQGPHACGQRIGDIVQCDRCVEVFAYQRHATPCHEVTKFAGYLRATGPSFRPVGTTCAEVFT